MENLLPDFVVTEQLNDTKFDALLVVGELGCHAKLGNTPYAAAVELFKHIDKSNDVKVIPCEVAPGRRIIHAPTGSVNSDFDDVRNFQEAAIKCMKKAISSGSKKPLIVLPSHEKYKYAEHATLLAALHAMYTPIEVREHKKTLRKFDTLGIYTGNRNVEKAKYLIFEVSALEAGRVVARDIGGSDPERMAAPRVVEYVNSTFKDSCIAVKVINDISVFEQEYPLLAAVNRATRNVPRHAGQLIKLEYKGEGKIEKTLMLVGKGITYDTGGADIKAGGVMAGMHRDKCGAAAVAGIFKMLSLYKPKNIKVIGAMAMVRNSVGSECYVSDEIILSRAGVRVRIGNTDAEGRMVMTDVLCEMKEKALNEVNPFLFTIATLTGHVIRCYGPNYASLIDNGPARKEKVSQLVSNAGELLGDPCEITRLRKEDFIFNQAPTEYEDVVQANTKASTMTDRGHMSPAAFMITASGLDKHGCDSANPLPYTHIDVAGSSGPYPGIPTGSPLLAITEAFILTNESSVLKK